MAKIRLPLGLMNGRARSAKVSGNNLKFVLEIGAAPDFSGKGELELSPSDLNGKMIMVVAYWGITKALPKLLLSVVRRK